MNKTEYNRTRRAVNIRHEICVACGSAKARPGRTRCDICEIIRANEQRELRAKRKRDGLCLFCGKPVGLSGVLCEFHRRYHRQARQKRRGGRPRRPGPRGVPPMEKRGQDGRFERKAH